MICVRRVRRRSERDAFFSDSASATAACSGDSKREIGCARIVEEQLRRASVLSTRGGT